MVELKTWPVGPVGELEPTVGTVTVKDDLRGRVALGDRVDRGFARALVGDPDGTPAVELKAIPQGLTRLESVIWATPAMSDTRLVCW